MAAKSSPITRQKLSDWASRNHNGKGKGGEKKSSTQLHQAARFDSTVRHGTIILAFIVDSSYVSHLEPRDDEDQL